MSKVLPPPPKGRPPTMKQPDKLYAYLCQKALSEGLDAGMVVVPGQNGAAMDAAFFYPGHLTKEQVEYFLKGGNSSTVANINHKPVVVKEETDDEILDKISGRFSTLQKLTHGVCSNNLRSLIVSGAGGVGKTYTVESILDHYKEKKNLHAKVIKTVVSPINLYIALYQYRQKGSVLVLDDADGVFFNEDSLRLLKAALDTGFTRQIAWMTNSNALSEMNIEKEFIYEGSMIFLTNLNFDQYTDKQNKIAPHLQALMTRSMYLDLKLHSPRELVLWIHHMVKKNHILKQNDLTDEQEDEVLDYLFSNQSNLRNLSIRSALMLADCIKMDPNDWRQLAKDTVLKD